MRKNKSVSVIIPIYNAEKYLAEAVDSVLSQTVKPLEIILVNDGSTDKSVEVAKKYKAYIRLLNQENKGISGARNAGIKAAKGTMIAFLDADDLWTKDHLEKLLESFEENDGLGLVAGHVEQFISEDDTESSKSISDEQKVLPGYVAGASLIKKEVFDNAGLFDEELTLAEYVDWFSRVKDADIPVKFLQHVVLKRRIHADNVGSRERNHIHDYTKVLMASIKRKREKERKNNS